MRVRFWTIWTGRDGTLYGPGQEEDFPADVAVDICQRGFGEVIASRVIEVAAVDPRPSTVVVKKRRKAR